MSKLWLIFDEQGSSTSAFLLVCPSLWTLYVLQNSLQENELVGTFAPSPSHTSRLVISENWKMKVHSQSMQNLEVHLSFSWKNCTGGFFWGKKKPVNERVSQVAVLLLRLWMVATPLRVLIRESKIHKMWAACQRYVFISQQPRLVNQTNITWARVSSWAEACGTNNKLMSGCFPGSQAAPHAHLPPVHKEIAKVQHVQKCSSGSSHKYREHSSFTPSQAEPLCLGDHSCRGHLNSTPGKEAETSRGWRKYLPLL